MSPSTIVPSELPADGDGQREVESEIPLQNGIKENSEDHTEGISEGILPSLGPLTASRSVEPADVGSRLSSTKKRKDRDENDQFARKDGDPSRDSSNNAPNSETQATNDSSSSSKKRKLRAKESSGVGEPEPVLNVGRDSNIVHTETMVLPLSSKRRREAEDKDDPIDPSHSEESAARITPPPSKKRHLETVTQSSNSEPTSFLVVHRSPSVATISAASDSHPTFETLPIELLAQILIATGSPKHVLAVARTCKSLCYTLLDINSKYIWRGSRKGPESCLEVDVPNNDEDPFKNIHPALIGSALVPFPWNFATAAPKKFFFVELPDPPSFMPEPAYAVFLFDGGICECCGKPTDMMYTSFALRVRLCKNIKCIQPPGLVPYTADFLNAILPTNEIHCLPREKNLALVDPWPSPNISYFFRKNDVVACWAERLEKSENEEYTKILLNKKACKKEWMEFCVKLIKWKKARQIKFYQVRKANETKGKEIATKCGWKYEELMTCKLYATYQKRKGQILESATEFDVKVMQEEIESTLIHLEDKREGSKKEKSLMQNRQEVEKLYQRLRSAQKYPYFPSLSTFRKLPVLSVLRDNILITLSTNTGMSGLLKRDVEEWIANAKRGLGAVLGFPKNWKTANKNILHPGERVTARFVCNRCKAVAPKYMADECLDFDGACKHECYAGNKSKRRHATGEKALWKSENFVKDQRAITIVKKILEAFGYAEDKDGGNYPFTVGLAVVCTSCNPPVVMDSRSVIGHSHRHKDMEVSFSIPEDIKPYLNNYPYEHGLVRTLLGPPLTDLVRTTIAEKIYGCRYCLRAHQLKAVVSHSEDNKPPDVASQAVKIQPSKTPVPQVKLSSLFTRMHDLGVEGPLEEPPVPLYDFNGLRSHIKSKHKFEHIRDEDIFCLLRPAVVSTDDILP